MRPYLTTALITGLVFERSTISGPGWEPRRLSPRKPRTGLTMSLTTKRTTRTVWRSTSRVHQPPANGTMSPAGKKSEHSAIEVGAS